MNVFGRMTISRDDVEAARLRAKEFLAFSSRGPYSQPTTRYDPFQRIFHWTLLALGAFLLASGLLMWEALTWRGVPLYVWVDRWNHTFMDDFMRTGHLVAAMAFAGLLVLHAYFAVLPQNRALLRSMTMTGGSRQGPANLDSSAELLPNPGGRLMGHPPSRFTLLIVGLMGLAEVSMLYLLFLYPGFVLAPGQSETAYFWPFSTRQLYFDVAAFLLLVAALSCFLACFSGPLTATTSPRGLPGRVLSRDRRYLLVGASFALFVPSIYFVVAPFDNLAGFAASIVAGISCWLTLRKDNGG
jgi:hypothetical protein